MLHALRIDSRKRRFTLEDLLVADRLPRGVFADAIIYAPA
jgi:hypothetical protein